MFFFIFKGGPFLVPIILASVVGLAIVFERFFVIHSVYRLDMEKFAQSVYRLLLDSRIDDAADLCRKNGAYPLPVMFAAAIKNKDLPRIELEKMLERMGNHYVKTLEKRLGGLLSIVGIAPLLGFLGTIAGLISAFMMWEKLGNDITVSALAVGMYQAMITTAAGLMVAIPFYLFYNYFISKIKNFAHEIDDYSGQLLEVMLRGKIV